jgi:type I restriction enzyme M protein
MPGFCRSAGIEELRDNDHVLVPGRYVGAARLLDTTDYGAELKRLRASLSDQIQTGRSLEQAILSELDSLPS